MFWKVFKRELKNTILSRRFLLYLFLIFLPVAVGAWFSWLMYNDPSIIENMTSMIEKPIQEVNPTVSMMSYLDLSTIPIALAAILHASGFIAGERTRNLLPLLVSKPFKRWKLLLGKYFSFISLFLPLLVVATTIMAVSIEWIGIGNISWEIYLGYLSSILLYALIYTNISTLFSSITSNSTYASLTSFIFLVAWIILDFLISYLPAGISDIVEEFSLSHHINKVLGYITNSKGAIFATGAVHLDPSTQSFFYSLAFLLIGLTVLPLLLSVAIFQTSDVKND